MREASDAFRNGAGQTKGATRDRDFRRDEIEQRRTGGGIERFSRIGCPHLAFHQAPVRLQKIVRQVEWVLPAAVTKAEGRLQTTAANA